MAIRDPLHHQPQTGGVCKLGCGRGVAGDWPLGRTCCHLLLRMSNNILGRQRVLILCFFQGGISYFASKAQVTRSVQRISFAPARPPGALFLVLVKASNNQHSERIGTRTERIGQPDHLTAGLSSSFLEWMGKGHREGRLHG